MGRCTRREFALEQGIVADWELYLIRAGAPESGWRRARSELSLGSGQLVEEPI